MVKTTKKKINKKPQNRVVAKKVSKVEIKKIETKKQDKKCSCKFCSCFKGNIALNIFFIAIYTFVILLFLTMWSKLYNKQVMKEQKCLVHKLYCCGYENKKECNNWYEFCRENNTEKLNCDLVK